MKMQYAQRDSEKAFANAIDRGMLSNNAGSNIYAGEYEYTHSSKCDEYPWVDHFKHHESCKYLPHTVQVEDEGIASCEEKAKEWRFKW